MTLNGKGAQGGTQTQPGPIIWSMMRSRWGIAAVGSIAAVLASLLIEPRTLLVWNVSASAPLGLYVVGGSEHLARGDMVVARLPSAMRKLAARRGYLPGNVPLVKRVAGVAGDRVCAWGPSVWINDQVVAERRAFDARGRVMPRWTGCVSLVDGDAFLLMPKNAASFDGRYFGVSAEPDILGKAVLIWRR